MLKYALLGTTGDVTACDCCGRSDLKKTVVLLVDGEGVKYYGVGCAANALTKWNGRFTEGREVRKWAEAKNANPAFRDMIRANISKRLVAA